MTPQPPGTPLSALTNNIDAAAKQADEAGIPYFIVGHVGDGNFHMGYLIDPDVNAGRATTEQLNHALVMRAISSPVRIANVMRSNRIATVAYAELLWSAHLEPHIRSRRWAYRPVEQGQIGVADGVMTDGAGAWRWSTLHCGSISRIIALESQPCRSWALPLHGKARHRAAPFAASALRRRTMEDARTGMCLTWSEVAGWTVEASCAPNGRRADRDPLIGLGGDRPHFWLFESEGQYVARACDATLQVRAESTSAAISALRQAITQYRRSYSAERSLPTVAVWLCRRRRSGIKSIFFGAMQL